MSWPVATQEYGTYQWLRREVGGSLGYGFDDATWTHEQKSQVDSIIQSGYMQMLYPPPIPSGDDAGKPVGSYQWSFLNPVSRLDLVANQKLYDLPDSFSGVIGDFTAEAD